MRSGDRGGQSISPNLEIEFPGNLFLGTACRNYSGYQSFPVLLEFCHQLVFDMVLSKSMQFRALLVTEDPAIQASKSGSSSNSVRSRILTEILVKSEEKLQIYSEVDNEIKLFTMDINYHNEIWVNIRH